MKIDVLTLFPKMLDGFVSESIVGRALREQLFSLQIYNLRDWTKDERRTVDDRPFGGGAGMVLQAEPLAELGEKLKADGYHLMSYSGWTFEQLLAKSEKEPQVKRLLGLLDVLVDGRFVLAERSLELKFRGSRNQRLINVPESLAQGKAVTVDL